LPTVWTSEGKLAQVFLNLLINAADAIEDGDVEHNRILIRTWTEGNDVFVEVTDSGRGIPAEDLHRIFEPFFTSNSTGRGAGLGLSICLNILNELGGGIRVESEVGKGTRFVVRLPVGQVPASRQVPMMQQTLVVSDTEAGLEVAPDSLVRGRILVVDDEAGLRRGAQRMLGHLHDVVLASSGKEARDILEGDCAFDLILCDVMMPEISGMDLHAWLVGYDPVLAGRVVFVTGGAFTPRAAEYLARVHNLRIEKPVEQSSFTALVAGLVEAARSERG
jgi:two-component system, NtrC family, sensor kinase